jgi:uncharacterized protein YbaR (Trm112 family)
MTDDANSQPDENAAERTSTVGPLGLEPWLVEILACPACRASVQVDEAASTIVCSGCGLAYPVRDGIPIMLVDEALHPSL